MESFILMDKYWISDTNSKIFKMEKGKYNEMTKELHISLNMPSMWIEKTELNKMEYLRLDINNLTCQVNDLRTSLKIHKEIVHNLLIENGGNQQFEVIEWIFNEMQRVKEKYDRVFEDKQRLEANCLLLEQINDEIKFKEKESEVILTQKIKELNEAIERKEFLFQLKEQKWTCIEKVMVDYAREDTRLQRMLADLRYIWDDVSTRRNVTNVLQENEDLKETIENQK